MRLQQVQSSAIDKVGYDPETELLAVVFKSGQRYDLSGVSAEEYARFMNAESMGRHFGQHLRGRYSAPAAAPVIEEADEPENDFQTALDASIAKFHRDAKDALQ